MEERLLTQHLLQTMIDYFEAGNQESDGAAKAILESAGDFGATWRQVIKRLQEGTEWTGLRAPEADLIASALRRIQQRLAASDQPGLPGPNS